MCCLGITFPFQVFFGNVSLSKPERPFAPVILNTVYSIVLLKYVLYTSPHPEIHPELTIDGSQNYQIPSKCNLQFLYMFIICFVARATFEANLQLFRVLINALSESHLFCCIGNMTLQTFIKVKIQLHRQHGMFELVVAQQVLLRELQLYLYLYFYLYLYLYFYLYL